MCKRKSPKKRTHKEFCEEIRLLTNGEYEVLSEFEKVALKVKMRHKICGNDYEVKPSNFFSGSRCPVCSRKNRRKKHEKFVLEVKNLCGDEYTVLGKYESNKKKVLMRHNSDACKNNEWEANPSNFISNGARCPVCFGTKKLTTECFIRKTKEKYGEEYTVLGKYNNTKSKIKMRHNNGKCNNHEWDVICYDFLNGHGCPICGGTKKITHEEFLEWFINEVGDEYILFGRFTKTGEKITVKHNVENCGMVYEVKANDFRNGVRCARCYGNKRKTTEELKKEIYENIGKDYTLVSDYVSRKTKVSVKHETCGNIYKTTRNTILQGCGCPVCRESKGERRVRKYLLEKVFQFTSQYRLKNCRNVNALPFDFAVSNNQNELSCLIEYDGEQHFKPIEHYGGEEGFRQRQHNDQIKNDYCAKKNIPLIRIPYWDFDNIETILEKELTALGIIREESIESILV